MQFVFQDPYASLDPRMSVGASIAEGVAANGEIARAGRAAEVRRLLELVRLDPDCGRLRPRQMSGGQRQRVAIARALAARPQILIADEITSALDVSVQGAVLNLLREIQRETAVGVLFISHNLAVVRYLADTIAVMNRGRLVESGPAQQVIDQPQEEYTKRLLAAVPTLRPAASAGASRRRPGSRRRPPAGGRRRRGRRRADRRPAAAARRARAAGSAPARRRAARRRCSG